MTTFCLLGWSNELRITARAPRRECNLRFMNWPNEPATESQLSRLRELGYSADCPLTKGEAASLIRVLEPVPATEAEGGGTSGQEVVTHTPYALRLSIEHTRRAVAEAEADQIGRLQCSFASVIAKRREFWADTCRDPGQMKARSSSTLELYMKQG